VDCEDIKKPQRFCCNVLYLLGSRDCIAHVTVDRWTISGPLKPFISLSHVAEMFYPSYV